MDLLWEWLLASSHALAIVIAIVIAFCHTPSCTALNASAATLMPNVQGCGTTLKVLRFRRRDHVHG